MKSVLYAALTTVTIACGFDFPPVNDLRIEGGIKQLDSRKYFVTVCNRSDKESHNMPYEVIFRLDDEILNTRPRKDTADIGACLDSEQVTVPEGRTGKLKAYADWHSIEDFPVDNYVERDI